MCTIHAMRLNHLFISGWTDCGWILWVLKQTSGRQKLICKHQLFSHDPLQIYLSYKTLTSANFYSLFAGSMTYSWQGNTSLDLFLIKKLIMGKTSHVGLLAWKKFESSSSEKEFDLNWRAANQWSSSGAINFWIPISFVCLCFRLFVIVTWIGDLHAAINSWISISPIAILLYGCQ